MKSKFATERLDLALVLAVVALAALSWPGTARGAEPRCEVSESGISDGVITPIDIDGARKSLAGAGIGVGGTYVGESFRNWGGLNQGVKYDGVLELHLNGDMEKIGLWKGLCFHASAYQIHGQSITVDNIGSLMPIGNLEATPATRLFELWFEQNLLNDHMSVRMGQLAADAEFLISEGGGYFLNGTWGWPSNDAGDLPNGGPAYPLATPGVRVAINPNDQVGLMMAVFNGDPVGPNCTGDPQECNDNGLDFRLDDPPLLMVEGSYKYNQEELAGTIKVGGLNHFGTFEHQRFDSGGLPIAVTGDPGRPLDNNWGVYGVIDQLIWRLPTSKEVKGVGVFGRVVVAPSDRNLIDFYADGGVTFSGIIPYRPDDSFAIGFAYTEISDQVHGFDLDSGLPVARTYEALLEICYTLQLKPGWKLQPDFQYISQPGGNVPDDSGDGAVDDAVVLGARTTVSF